VRHTPSKPSWAAILGLAGLAPWTGACGGSSGAASAVDATAGGDAVNDRSGEAQPDSGVDADLDVDAPDSPADAGLDLDAPAESACSGWSACPPSVPEAGSACDYLATENTTCEYGDDPRPYLNAIVRCLGNPRGLPGEFPGQWQVSLPPDASVSPPLPSGCPATLAEAQASTACAVDASLPAECYYPGGSCVCSPGGDGGPSFVCVAAAAGCPSVRPRIGTPCADAVPSDAQVPLCRYTQDYCRSPTAELFCSCGVWGSFTAALCGQ